MNLKYWEWRSQRMVDEKARRDEEQRAMDMTGFCMCQYERETCHDCLTEDECMTMIREGKNHD